MDLQDLSNDGRYVQRLELLKNNLQADSKREGQIPMDRASRAQMIMEQQVRIMSDYKKQKGVDATLFLLPPYVPSVAPLKGLEKLLIKDMRLETHHRGLYILLRVVTSPFQRTDIVAVVEDETEDVVLLQLYHQDYEKVRYVFDIARTKSVCIVKEPYFKIAGEGNYTIRVDHVSDLIWLSKDDERLPECWCPRIVELDNTADEWKREGNADFASKKYHDTVEKYIIALQCSPTAEETQIIKTNRSLAYLQLQRYDEALLDITRSPAGDVSEKGLFRAALAYYGLERFSDCHASLKLLLQKYPANESAKKNSAQVQHRLREQSWGEYDWRIMYEATEMMPLSLDNATYFGPVEVKSSKGMGRGLFTTRAIKVGELVLCEKAFPHSYAYTDREHSSAFGLLMDAGTNRIIVGTEAHLITAIVQQLQRNPSQMPAFLSLHHGSYEATRTTEVDGEPVVDTFLIARIVALNAFGCPLTSLEELYNTSRKDIKGLSKTYASSGIWVYASYINHSCYSNVRRSFIGDMQIVRATRNIPAGEELTFWYQHPENTGYKTRQEKFQHWGFECTCAICADDKNSSKRSLNMRHNLLGDFQAAFSAPNGPNIAKAKRVLTALEKTYQKPATEVPRLALWQQYLVLLRLHAAENQPKKVISTARNFLASLGFLLIDNPVSGAATMTCRPFQVEQWGLMVDPVIEVCMALWTAYAIVAPDLADMAEAYAKTAYKICVGEDSTFDEKIGGLARRAIESGLCYEMA